VNRCRLGQESANCPHKLLFQMHAWGLDLGLAESKHQVEQNDSPEIGIPVHCASMFTCDWFERIEIDSDRDRRPTLSRIQSKHLFSRVLGLCLRIAVGSEHLNQLPSGVVEIEL
jgi:hypothetical protein